MTSKAPQKTRKLHPVPVVLPGISIHDQRVFNIQRLGSKPAGFLSFDRYINRTVSVSCRIPGCLPIDWRVWKLFLPPCSSSLLLPPPWSSFLCVPVFFLLDVIVAASIQSCMLKGMLSLSVPCLVKFPTHASCFCLNSLPLAIFIPRSRNT